MTRGERTVQSDYMRFAKLDTAAACNLAGSGVADCSLSELGVTLDDLELHGANAYGYPPLLEAIAQRFAVDPAEVMTAAGASFANHLALAALVSAGDEVLVEEPTYELLLSTLAYLGAEVRRFTRRPENAWRLDAAEVAARLTPRTRLVVLTNLHNPSSALASEAEIEAAARAAEAVGATVLVDEVYLEMTFRSGGAHTAFRCGGNVVVTSSLTKAYGLSGLRCGWILAARPLAERMRRLNDLFAAVAPHVTERLSVAAFAALARLRARANAIINANRAAHRQILGQHPALEQHLFDDGATVFPRLLAGDGEAFAARLKADWDTSVAPGRYFGRPDHVRIGLGGDPAMSRRGYERIARALNAA